MRLPNIALCIASHDTQPHFCAGLVEGGVALGSSSASTRPDVIHLNGSIRGVAYSRDDSISCATIYAAADNGNLYCLSPESGTLSSTFVLPSTDAPLSALVSVASGVVAAGDDEGGLHLFDTRKPCANPVASILEQGDYISAIKAFGESGLAVSSGDGTLCMYDTRLVSRPRLKLIAATPSFEDDLLSLCIAKNGTRAVAGTLSGAMNVYNMQFVDADEDEPDMSRFVDRFYGHPESVSAVVAVEDPEIVLTGSSDGIVRVVDPVQKTFLGVLPYATKQETKNRASHLCLEPRTIRDCSDDAAQRTNVVKNRRICRDHGNETERKRGGDVGVRRGRDHRDDTGEPDGSPESGHNSKYSDSSNDQDNGEVPNVERDSASPTASDDDMIWPIEGMTIINGEHRRVLALVGHNQYVRFCDCSLLNDSSDEDDAEGNTKPAQSKANTSAAEEHSLDHRRTAAACVSSSGIARSSKRQRKAQKWDKNERKAFFDGL